MCNVSLQRLNVNSSLKSVLKRLRLKMGTWNDSLWDASGSIYQGPIVGRLINLFVWLLCWAAHAAKNKTDNLSHLRKSLEIPARGKFSLNCHTPFFLLSFCYGLSFKQPSRRSHCVSGLIRLWQKLEADIMLATEKSYCPRSESPHCRMRWASKPQSHIVTFAKQEINRFTDAKKTSKHYAHLRVKRLIIS